VRIYAAGWYAYILTGAAKKMRASPLLVKNVTEPRQNYNMIV
jgi:hypothetical protein